jgi:hypothetical protein
MRAFAALIVVLAGAAQADSKSMACGAAARALKAPDQEYEARLALLNACAPEFSDATFAQGWKSLRQVSPFAWAGYGLDFARDGYCKSTKSTDLTACTLPREDAFDVPAGELNRQWRLLLARIFEADLGKKAGRELAADFEASWANVFPIEPPIPELAPGLTMRVGADDERKEYARLLLPLRDPLLKCFGGERHKLTLNLGPGEPSATTRKDTTWQERACAKDVLKTVKFPRLRNDSSVTMKWDMTK